MPGAGAGHEFGGNLACAAGTDKRHWRVYGQAAGRRYR
jgi:hypothetical protein